MESLLYRWHSGVSLPNLEPKFNMAPEKANTDMALGYYALPDLPSNTRVHWLKAEEKVLALERMQRAGKQLEEPFTTKGLKRVLGHWHFWVYTTYYT